MEINDILNRVQDYFDYANKQYMNAAMEPNEENKIYWQGRKDGIRAIQADLLVYTGEGVSAGNYNMLDNQHDYESPDWEDNEAIEPKLSEPRNLEEAPKFEYTCEICGFPSYHHLPTGEK